MGRGGGDLLIEALSWESAMDPAIWARKRGVFMGWNKSDFILAGMYLVDFQITSESDPSLQQGPVVKLLTTL